MLTRPLSPWCTVVAGTFGSAVGAGTIMVYAYGILAAAMGAELGWGRDLLARNMTAFLIGSGIGTITLGWLISRFGIRGPSAWMAGSFGVLFAAVSQLPAVPWVHLIVFLLIGVMGSACTALPYSVAISGFFEERRGLALGLVVAGSGAGSMLGPRIARSLVTHYGWRTGFAEIGIAAAAISVAGLVLLVRTPAGVVAGPDHRASSPAPGELFSFVNGDFWRIAVPILVVSAATFGAMASLVPLFTDARINADMIARALSFAGLCTLGARILIGYLLDKIFAPFVCAAVFASAAGGLVLLMTGASSVHVYAGSAMVAIAMGAEADLVTFLVSRYFRLLDYSRVVGIMWVVWAWGGGLGTFVAARSFGIFGSYHPAFLGFAGALLLGAIVVLMLGPYRNHSTPAQSPRSSPSVPASKELASPTVRR